jgi:hypothetical protein
VAAARLLWARDGAQVHATEPKSVPRDPATSGQSRSDSFARWKNRS